MADTDNNAVERQPVVVVMGHVDHGKTTLLDYIRKANVAGREAGGITQAIGAYEIEHATGGKTHKITFIDTPGHEAFSKMRSRGAATADLAILVVAAEEGVKPQTKEAIQILEETKTPFVVALTKIDKPGADVDKVKNDLMSHGVFLEGYGGSISYQPLSAKSGEGVDELLDLLVLAAELEELRYDPKAPAEGFILETRTNKNRGMEATVIVKNGILRRGDDIATAAARGKVKILENFLGKAIGEAPAGAPVLIVGWEALPAVGEVFVTGPAATDRVLAGKAEAAAFDKEAMKNALPVLLKAADAGSLEALSQIMRNIVSERPLKILSESVGEVGENDVKLAMTVGATIIAFKSKTDKSAKNLSQAQGITILSSEIVYELVIAIEAMLKESAEKKLGELEVLAVFNKNRLDKQVIGGKVVSGSIKKTVFEARRGEEKLGMGRVMNLQQGKEDTSEVREGNECGLMVTAGFEVQVGDKLVILPELK